MVMVTHHLSGYPVAGDPTAGRNPSEPAGIGARFRSPGCGVSSPLGENAFSLPSAIHWRATVSLVMVRSQNVLRSISCGGNAGPAIEPERLLACCLGSRVHFDLPSQSSVLPGCWPVSRTSSPPPVLLHEVVLAAVVTVRLQVRIGLVATVLLRCRNPRDRRSGLRCLKRGLSFRYVPSCLGLLAADCVTGAVAGRMLTEIRCVRAGFPCGQARVIVRCLGSRARPARRIGRMHIFPALIDAVVEWLDSLEAQNIAYAQRSCQVPYFRSEIR